MSIILENESITAFQKQLFTECDYSSKFHSIYCLLQFAKIANIKKLERYFIKILVYIVYVYCTSPGKRLPCKYTIDYLD